MTKRQLKLFSAAAAAGAYLLPAVALAAGRDNPDIAQIVASAVPKVLIACVIGAVVAFVARNNAIASMKSAREKTQANDYAQGRGLDVSIANNQLMGRTQRAVPLAQMQQSQGVNPYAAAGAGAGAYGASQYGRQKTDASQYGRVSSDRTNSTGPKFDSRPGTGTFGTGGKHNTGKPSVTFGSGSGGKHSSGKPSISFGSSRPSSGGKGGFSRTSSFGGRSRSSGGGKSFGGSKGGGFKKR